LKIKADENIGHSGVGLLRKAGHDVTTVREQELGGTADDTVFQVCRMESPILITLDHDFAQVRHFPPGPTTGIVVLEPGGRATIPMLCDRLREFLALAATRPVGGELWIVEPGRVRVHSAQNDA
jgi:hypothetical protein